MRKMGRFLAFFLILLLAAPAVLADGETFTMLAFEPGETSRDWTANLFFQRMEERTGIAFTFDKYIDAAAYAQAKDAAFTAGPLPDVLFKANLTPEEEMAYVRSGQLVDLAPYLADYAPNLSTILAARPDWAAVITQPDGAIASLPVLNGSDRQAAIWINRSWLEALNLSMPTTIDEYTEVLRAFRDGDPNGNGSRDEVPLSIVSPWEAKFFLHAWGLVPNDYNIYVDDAGAVRFAPFEPAYRDFVAWLHMALDEGLIYENAFRTSQSGRTQELSSAESGSPITIGGMVTTAPYTLIDMGNTADYSVLLPLFYNGKQVYRQLLDGVGRGAFAITSAAADSVPALLGWIDYLYSEEGGRLAFAGQEGIDYTIAADGTWKWDGEDDYIRLSEIAETVLIAGDAITPGLEPAAFMRNSEIDADNHARRQTDTLRPYLVQAFPVTWPTDAAREARIAELQAALATCLDTAIANFAMGKVELTDETWAALQEELRALGADEFVALWQAKYDELT